MTAERQFRILWGPTLETPLDFSWPVVGDSPRVWRELRAGSERLDGATTADVNVTGKDFFLGVTAKWFDLQHLTGGTGLQAFIDWANAGNAFTLVPNTLVPALTVPGCFLDAPFLAPAWSNEQDSTLTVDLVIRHPTSDLGLAWRGLFFEYVAGTSLTDPVAYTYSRASVGYEINNQGYLTQNPSGTICDGNYASPFGSGLQTTLLEMAVTNDIANPEDLTNASWLKTRVTITANNAKAPDQNVTADAVIEDTSVTTTHQIGQNLTIVAGDAQTVLAFVRANGRYRGQLQMSDNVSRVFAVDYDLSAKTLTPSAGGGPAVPAATMTQLAGGWFMIWMRGTIGGAATAVSLYHWLADGTGSLTYTGDGASGVYYWGVTAVHGVNKVVASYTPTTSVADELGLNSYTPPPQAAWWYIKFVESGGQYTGGAFTRLMELASSEFIAPSWNLINSTLYGWNLHLTTGDANVSRAFANVGDVVELLLILYADASIEMRQSINGGAESTSGRSAPVSGGLPSAWSGSPTKFSIGDSPQLAGGRTHAMAVNTVRHGPGVAVNTIAAARVQ